MVVYIPLWVQMTSVYKETSSLSSLTFFCAIYFHKYFIFTATETFKTKPTLLYKQKALSCSCLFRFLAWVLLSGQDLMELAAHGLGWDADQAGLGLPILLPLLLSSC